MEVGPVAVSYDRIKSLLVNSTDPAKHNSVEHGQEFLPRKTIEDLIQKKNVESTLREKFDEMEGEGDLVDFYANRNASIVFLTLVRIGARHEIWKALQQNKFTDDCLPVRRPGTNQSEEIHSIEINGTPKDSGTQKFAGSSGWTSLDRDNFLEYQWLFMVPEFQQCKFEYEFAPECRLPFVAINDGVTHRGHFGTVYKLGLRLDHTDFTGSRALSTSKENYIKVALKVMAIESTGTTGTDVEKFYGKEKATLEKMRDLNHSHLVKAFAAYKRGTYRCFIFPWADGGNLNNFWKRNLSKHDNNLVTWAFTQMYGISEGIEKLHKDHIRHGDIKPLNILHFTESNDASTLGHLVVADVGLAKVHEIYTRDRNPGTTTRHGTDMYEPPEMVSFSVKTTKISTSYDVWSLGCIFLEFVIWLHYGQEELEKLHRDLEVSNARRFWVSNSHGHRLHEAVDSQIDRMKSGLDKNSVLDRLVGVIYEKLLVGLDKRIDAASLVRALQTIQIECKVEMSNLGRGADVLAEQGAGLDASEPTADPEFRSPSNQYLIVTLGPKNHTSKLDNHWKTVPQNKWATLLVSRLEWATLRPETETAELCASCKINDFLALRLSLHRSLSDLERGARACSMCSFLHHCLSKSSLNRDEIVDLSIDDAQHTLMLSHHAIPAISIYLDPESSDRQLPQLQVGLPLLPPPGSSQQVIILNEWVRLCNEDHHCIPKADIGGADILPTRLIEVGTSQEPTLCLIETKDHGITGNYIALSHCWGDLPLEKRVCTYSENINIFKNGIPFNVLPTTFQDAVTITRALAVRYLWIDSLCIIQGNTEDWKIEAGKMEDVFSSAYCTIAASSATSSLDGFLFNRAQRASIGIHTPRGTLYLAEVIDDFEAHVEKGVLNTRGWVLQERALSRRTIHFTSTQVYWECGEGVHCETLAELGNRQSMFLGDSNFPTYGLEHYKDERIRLVQYLYQVYSGLDLTKPYDRSKAILGLQKRLGSTFKSKVNYGVISAYFERTFLWQADVPGSLTKVDYEPGSTVPSWSWMALMGKIRYIDIPFGGVTWTGDLENPFHAGFDDAKWDGRLVAKAKRLAIDDGILQERCKIDISPYKFEPNSWRGVVVGEGKVAYQDGDIDQYVLLIRKRSSGVAPPVYERVGVGILSQRHISSETTIIHIR